PRASGRATDADGRFGAPGQRGRGRGQTRATTATSRSQEGEAAGEARRATVVSQGAERGGARSAVIRRRAAQRWGTAGLEVGGQTPRRGARQVRRTPRRRR